MWKCIHPSEHVYLVFQHVLVLCNAIGTPLDSKYIEIGKQLAWENRRNFATTSVVFPRNNVWEMSAETPYWWRVTTQIWVVLPDLSCRVRNLLQPIRSITQIWVVALHQYGISALISQTLFRAETTGNVAKCRLFSQASKQWGVVFCSLTGDSNVF